MDKTTAIKSISQKEREKYNAVHREAYKGGDFVRKRSIAFKEGRSLFYSRLKEIIQYETESLLDAGCGKGNFGSIIRDMCPLLFMDGADISDTAIKYCKKIKVYNNLYRSDLSLLHIPKKYDMVMLLDGMEHIHKEREEEVFANLYKHSKKYIALSISTSPASQDKNSIAAGYDKVHINLKSVGDWLGFFSRMKETYPFEIHTFTKNKMNIILKK